MCTHSPQPVNRDGGVGQQQPNFERDGSCTAQFHQLKSACNSSWMPPYCVSTLSHVLLTAESAVAQEVDKAVLHT
jgi:hypothetical protein